MRKEDLKERVRDTAVDRFIRAGVKVLERRGWAAVVVGPVNIERLPEDKILNHRLVLQFTGFKYERRKSANDDS